MFFNEDAFRKYSIVGTYEQQVNFTDYRIHHDTFDVMEFRQRIGGNFANANVPANVSHVFVFYFI